MIACLIYSQVRSDDIKSVVAKRMQASKANKVMASIMPEFATFQVGAKSSLNLALRSFNRNSFLIVDAGTELLGVQRGMTSRDARAKECQALRPHVAQLQLLSRRRPTGCSRLRRSHRSQSICNHFTIAVSRGQ